VSDTIDEEFSRQRVSNRKGPKPIKILLLGAQLNMVHQLTDCFCLFRAEKVYWRSIIQLNVAQSVLTIPDIVSRAHAVSHSFSSRSSSSQSSSGHEVYPPLTTDHLKLKMRLAPLGQVEAALISKI
ncbi:hypothetical protein EDC04DRAFT_2543341, partial [Pisolithus marmoratus]